MNNHSRNQQSISESGEDWRFSPQEEHRGAFEKEYLVNEFGLWHRIRNTLLGLCLLAYGAYGVWKNDLYISWGRLSRVHLHGAPAWVMYAAMICGAASLLSVVVDHYDQRNNEERYECFRQVVFFLGFILGLGVLLWNELAH
ncbi:MAG: hypothetical protein Q4A28_04070 [Brachymonas sp.]|nr:hypothetical protein [Brachymonas sp.]